MTKMEYNTDQVNTSSQESVLHLSVKRGGCNLRLQRFWSAALVGCFLSWFGGYGFMFVLFIPSPCVVISLHPALVFFNVLFVWTSDLFYLIYGVYFA